MICRMIPLLRDQLKNKRPINLYFIWFELIGSICLGVSALLIAAYPFIVLNFFCICATIFILIMQASRNKDSEKKMQSEAGGEAHSRPEARSSEV
jgi:large-conductance mechanosensitive channel